MEMGGCFDAYALWKSNAIFGNIVGNNLRIV